MSIIDPYIKKLDSIKLDLEEIAKQIVIDNAKEIIDINRRALRKGLDAHGKHISRRYTSKTQSYWRKKDPPRYPAYKVTTNYYDFYWSGETQDEMYVTFDSKDEFSIFSASGKASFLSKFYNQLYDFDMFGLNEKDNRYVNEQIILPNLHKYILDNMVRV